MTMVTIDTEEQFKKWLDENFWFEDGQVLSITPPPTVNEKTIPSTVTLELAYQIEGNYKANSTSVSRVFRLVAIGIEEYHLSEESGFDPEHFSEGVEILNAPKGIAFTIDVPAVLTLRCSKITIKELPNLVATVKPWISDREVYAKIQFAKMPTPTEWVHLFEKLGQNVSWHIYRGEIKTHSQVPQSNYEGWFLQNPANLDKNHQGIFFFSCHQNDIGFRLQLQKHGASESLWHTAMVIIGQFKHAEVSSGNCEFSAAEWLEQISKTSEDG